MSTPHHLTALLSLLLCSCGQSESSDAPIPTVVDTAASSSRDEAPERVEEEVTFGPFRREDLNGASREELHGGYHVLYTIALDTIGTGDTAHIYTAQIAQLWKDTLISVITSCSYGLPEKNLGYVMVDYPKWLIYVQVYGPGNPIEAQLVEKATGQPLADDGFYFLDHDTLTGYALLGKYGDNQETGVARSNDSLLLIDAKANPEFFPHPDSIDGTHWFMSTTISSLSRDRLVIEYPALPDGMKRAEYRRR